MHYDTQKSCFFVMGCANLPKPRKLGFSRCTDDKKNIFYKKNKKNKKNIFKK